VRLVIPSVGSSLRALWAWAPLVGLVSRPEARPNGISAVVRVRGDEEWVEPCLRSIADFADEIIVLDNGAASTTAETLRSLQPLFDARLRIERCPGVDLFALSNLGLDAARLRWVIRWDADFVAHTEGEHDIGRLRRFLLALDPRRYHVVYVPAAEVAGDLAHQFPDRRVRFDGAAHTASAGARYVAVDRDLPVATLPFADRVLRRGSIVPVKFESIQLPRYYRVHTWPSVTYLHVDVKSRRHMLLRHFWLEWLREATDPRYPTLEAYARAQIAERWGLADLDTAADLLMTRYCEGLVPFDASRCGPYPAALRPYLDKPRFRVEYADGRVVGRSEAG
jgi:glycosyltransferase involved in cell wall biosynthesis